MEPRIIDIDEYMPLVQELLAQGKSVSLTVTGESMSPFLRHGRDQIRLRPSPRRQNGVTWCFSGGATANTSCIASCAICRTAITP